MRRRLSSGDAESLTSSSEMMQRVISPSRSFKTDIAETSPSMRGSSGRSDER